MVVLAGVVTLALSLSHTLGGAGVITLSLSHTHTHYWGVQEWSPSLSISLSLSHTLGGAGVLAVVDPPCGRHHAINL